MLLNCLFSCQKDYLEQGSQTQLPWGPPEVEFGSGWAASIMPQKIGAQLTQSKIMIGLSLDHVGYVIADNRGHFMVDGGNRDILASFGFCRDSAKPGYLVTLSQVIKKRGKPLSKSVPLTTMCGPH